MSGARPIGETVLSVENVSLAFGGVKALSEVSFDVREHEVRAIIGPNGAGKSSMLNVINGVYHPQHGTIRLRRDGAWREFHDMDSHEAAAMGIARTFQNIALFKGMSVLDNIMTGRNLKMSCNFLEQALWIGRARREEIEHRHSLEKRNVLERARDAHLGRHVRVHVVELAPTQLDGPLLRVVDAIDDVKHGTLAGAVGADDRAHLVLAHVERNITQRLDAAEGERHAVDREDHLADALRARILHSRHQAAFLAAAIGYVFASRIFTSAEIDPMRPSS